MELIQPAAKVPKNILRSYPSPSARVRKSGSGPVFGNPAPGLHVDIGADVRVQQGSGDLAIWIDVWYAQWSKLVKVGACIIPI